MIGIINISKERAIVNSKGRFHVVKGKENHPVINVSWYGAKAGRKHAFGSNDGTFNKSK